MLQHCHEFGSAFSWMAFIVLHRVILMRMWTKAAAYLVFFPLSTIKVWNMHVVVCGVIHLLNANANANALKSIFWQAECWISKRFGNFFHSFLFCLCRICFVYLFISLFFLFFTTLQWFRPKATEKRKGIAPEWSLIVLYILCIFMNYSSYQNADAKLLAVQRKVFIYSPNHGLLLVVIRMNW